MTHWLRLTNGGNGERPRSVNRKLNSSCSRWKVRAVGQGYHDGLAGLARDFGVDIDDEPPPPPQGVDWRRPPVPAGYEL